MGENEVGKVFVPVEEITADNLPSSMEVGTSPALVGVYAPQQELARTPRGVTQAEIKAAAGRWAVALNQLGTE